MSASNTQTVEAFEDQESPASSTVLKTVLYRLACEQVNGAWPFIRVAVLKSWPAHLPMTETVLANIYTALLTGELECWMLTNVNLWKPAESKPLAIGLVALTHDWISQQKFLTIYSLYSFERVPLATWRDAFVKLAEYARKIGCDRVLANTESAAVVRLVKKLGGHADARAVQLEVQQ